MKHYNTMFLSRLAKDWSIHPPTYMLREERGNRSFTPSTCCFPRPELQSCH